MNQKLVSRSTPYDGRSRDSLRILVKESRPGGPWAGKILVRWLMICPGVLSFVFVILAGLVRQEIQNLDPGTVVWELKQQLFEQRDGYPPGNSRHASCIMTVNVFLIMNVSH